VFAALVAASALLSFRVQARATPCLLAGNALAHFWALARLQRAAGAGKAIGYALMHAGGRWLHGESAPGWLVPASRC
jgi:hypothetical protein